MYVFRFSFIETTVEEYGMFMKTVTKYERYNPLNTVPFSYFN